MRERRQAIGVSVLGSRIGKVPSRRSFAERERRQAIGVSVFAQLPLSPA